MSATKLFKLMADSVALCVVWTCPIKVLLLHGGPAATHQYMECFQSFFPKEGIEFYEYDQLGCGNSDKPADTSLWTLDRFVDEVEQVRQAIGADKKIFTYSAIHGEEYLECTMH